MKALKSHSLIERLSIRTQKRADKKVGVARKKVNQMPGSLIYTGRIRLKETTIEVIHFDIDSFSEETISQAQIDEHLNSQQTLWLNVVGLHDVELIRKIGDVFKIHNLILEDIMNVNQRPKFNEYEDNFFVTSKMLNMVNDKINSEQVSMVVGAGFIITFQERPGDVFDSVRGRLKQKKGRIRQRGADYLAFALLDVIVDNYMVITEVYADEVSEQETEILEDANKDILEEITLSKKEVNYLRRHVRPLREAILNFSKSESELIDKKTRPFLRDLLDHVTHASESLEGYREAINDNLAAYHSQVSARLNDILKVLTIFSVIFIPLTFMAGIYGMNFDYIPELKFKYSYPIFWGLLIVVASSMLLYFKRKKWL